MFLKSLSRAGFDVYGVEPSQANQLDPSPKELNIASRDMCDLHYPDSYFDIITLWHVLEHISNPRGILKEIKRIIKAKGTLIMAIPNFESLEAKLSHKNWFHLDLPRHLYHYNPATLENMLKIEGFKIFKIEYFSLEFGPFGLFQTLMNMLGGEFNFLAKILKGNNINKFQSNKRYYSLGIFLFLMPFLPLIILFSFVEACCKKGAILTVYAKAIK
jgi:SAM-dependent methyltransferase